MYICSMKNTEIKRLQFNLPFELYDLVKGNMKKYGFSSVTPFLRYIIFRFFEENK